MKRAFAALLASVALAPPVSATVMTLADDEMLVDYADLVVSAEVVRVTAAVRERGRIVTSVELRVVETLAGGAPETLVVEVLGGALPTGEELYVGGAPRFAPGETVLLFLRARTDRSYRVAHFNQGVFRERGTTDLRVYVRELGASVVVVQPGRERATEVLAGPRHARAFADWIRDRAAGRSRPADYFDPALPTPELEPIDAGFSVRTASGAYVRWQNFDSGGQVLWYRNERGQAGLAGGGAAEFRAAMDAWNDEPHTRVRYVDAGTTSIDDALAIDGINLITFDDPYDDIDGDYCEGTAIIGAVGPVIHGFTVPDPWRGSPTWATQEAAVLINDGFECFGEFSSSLMAQLYTHELGHTLGLGHSFDGDGNYYAQYEATMAGAAHGDGRGAWINPDDARGLRFIYDASYVPADCDSVGGADYCHPDVCGPCGPEQGDCDSDADCVFDSACVDDVGPQYGFAPGIDVCVEGAVGGGGNDSLPAPGALAAALVDAGTARLTWTDNSDGETGFPGRSRATGGCSTAR